MAEKNPKAPDTEVDPRDAEIAALKAQLAAQPDVTTIARTIGAEIAKALKPGAVEAAKLRKHLPLAEEHKGSKTYVVGASRHYRNGKTYQKGELITVTNERPARDWKLFDPGAGTPAAQADALPPTRANDRSVG